MAALPAFKLLQFADQTIQRFQANVAAVLQPLGLITLLNGTLAVYSATVDIPSPNTFVLTHNLGRAPVGIIPLVAPYTAFTTPGFGANFVQAKTPSATPNINANLLCTNEIRKGALLSFWVF